MRVGMVGWRGMVGSVLLQRMRQENDFKGLDTRFFSTSNTGGVAPPEAGGRPLLDAYDLAELGACDLVITCQGGSYTERVYGDLRAEGFRGIWVDASSALRMSDESTLVLDPVNGAALREALGAGKRTFSGANCTVSLMLMAMLGLLRSGEVEWISSMTYQAASGAGAGLMRELVSQMRDVGLAAGPLLDDPASSALEVDRAVQHALVSSDMRVGGAPLAGSALPWIDKALPSGQTREEWKAAAEAGKLLGHPVRIDGLCVRIGALRCHAQGLTIKLKRPMAPTEAEALLADAHPWVKVVPNDKASTLEQLTPAAVAGSLQVPIGRLRAMSIGDDFLTAFTVGDQLLWGAAEPLRRMLGIVREAHR